VRIRPLVNQKFAMIPSHTKAIVATAFWTGMRRNEILKLTWDKIDLQNRLIRLRANATKEGRRKIVPISNQLKTVLTRLPNRLHGADENNYVFQYKGGAVSDIRTGLKNGCELAGIPYGRNLEDGFTFHDLRHTFATNARKAGVEKNVIMVIMGHSAGNDMNFRYDSVDEADLLNAVDQIELFLESVDNPVDQGQKKGSQEESQNRASY